MDGHDKVGGGAVTRFEGTAQEMIVFLDQLRVDSAGEPLATVTGEYIDVIGMLDGVQSASSELVFDFFLVSPAGPATTSGVVEEWHFHNAWLKASGFDGATADDVAQVVDGTADLVELTRVVGPDETGAAIAIRAYEDYTLRSKVTEGLSRPLMDDVIDTTLPFFIV
jgi:hypothetical protein